MPLREEIEKAGPGGFLAWQPETVPRLDSFLKESARLNPSDASKSHSLYHCYCTWLTIAITVSVRRKVLAPYTFSDGTHFEEGSWACVPQRSLMRDNKVYASADCFQGFRFLSTSDSGSASKFTDVGPTFPFWGAGKRVW